MASPDLVARWRALTCGTMPGLAGPRGWPVRFDHCFQRILLDNGVGGAWRGVIAAPAWPHATDEQLGRAIALGEAAVAGTADLNALNARSLAWRGRRSRN